MFECLKVHYFVRYENDTKFSGSPMLVWSMNEVFKHLKNVGKNKEFVWQFICSAIWSF